MRYKKMQMGGEQEQILQFLQQYAQEKGIDPQALIADFQQATPEQQQEFLAQLQEQETEMQYGGAHYNKNLNYILPNSILDRKNKDVEEPTFKLKRKELQGDRRNGYAAYEQDGDIYMNNINDEPLKQHETFHYLRSKGYFSPREQAIEDELLDGSIYSPLDKNKLNTDVYSPEELAARFHSISGYLPNNYKEEDFKKLWETGKDSQIQDLKQVIPYDKALYYMNNYHPSKMQMGGNSFNVNNAKSSGKKAVLKQANWLNDWYGTRDIVTEPIKLTSDVFNYEYYPNPETRPKEVKDTVQELEETWGFEPGGYSDKNVSVFLSNPANTTNPIHEFTHAIDRKHGNFGTKTTPNILKRLYDELFGNDLKTDYRKLKIKPLKEHKYYTNPQESYARLNELRYTSGYEPNYKPTIENIQTLRKKNKRNKLFKHYDDNSIMQMWNGLSSNDFTSPTIDNPMLQQTAKFGIKNKIPRSEKGMYEFPNQPVVVPTRGTGNITMSGINYPVEAYNANTMEYLDLMQPNQEYQFDGVDDVLEIPQAKFGIQKMQAEGKVRIKKTSNGNFIGDDGYEYGYDKNKNQFYKINKFTEVIVPNNAIEVVDFNLTQEEKNKFLKNILPEVQIKGKKPKATDYFQKPITKFPNSFNLSYNAVDSTSNYSENTPVEAIGNSNLRVGDKVDTVGRTPVKNFETANKNPLKEDWVNEWGEVDSSFKDKSFEQQQKFAKNYIKSYYPEYYNGLSKSFKGFNIDKMTSDKKFGNITNQLRPSLITGNINNLSNHKLSDLNFFETDPTNPEDGIGIFPIVKSSSPFPVLEDTPYLLDRQKEDIPLELKNLGKLDTRDYSSQYLSNAKLRNNRVMAPYFRRSDLALPELYQEDVSPYLGNINRMVRGAMQNINSNSTVGQAAYQQLASNAAFQSNAVQGQVANRNLERKITWNNTVAGIKSQQSQIDDANRAGYTDDWMKTLAAKDNVDNLIDLQAAQFKMNKQREGNQNMMNAAISSMINPNYDLQIDNEGNILYGIKQGQKFKNSYVSKFGLKTKALY